MSSDLLQRFCRADDRTLEIKTVSINARGTPLTNQLNVLDVNVYMMVR
jgi:hypothetical protein